jgi:hypothetical protein
VSALAVLQGSRGLLQQPGTVAFLIVFGMAVVCVFLFRSMSKHLRKVNDAARAEAEAADMAARAGSAQPVAGDDGVGSRRRP